MVSIACMCWHTMKSHCLFEPSCQCPVLHSQISVCCQQCHVHAPHGLPAQACSMLCALLAGLQCTRLPLLPADANSSAGDSPDCTATRWPVTADARFEALGGALNSSSSSNSSDSNSSNGNSALAAALSWLSCSAQYCCGLQVVPTDSGDQGKGGAVPGVAAFDGPDGADNSSEANATMVSCHDPVLMHSCC